MTETTHDAEHKNNLAEIIDSVRDKIEDAQLRLGDARDELDFLENSLDAALDTLEYLDLALNEEKKQ